MTQVLHQTKYLSLVEDQGWVYAKRPGAGVVAVVAFPGNDQFLLVEQRRRPVGNCPVIELPAGLVDPGETYLEAAQRELLEETGYKAKDWREMGTLCVSPGLTDELVTFFEAHDLERVSTTVGVDGEQIKLHHVGFREYDKAEFFYKMRREHGCLVSASVYAGMQLAGI